MPRTARSVAKRARHRKWIKRAKGYRGRRSKVFKLAKEATLKAGQHAYTHRRAKKSDFRRRWQTHINAAAKRHDLSYSQFIHGLKKNKINLNRKMLATLAQEEPQIFADIVEQAKK